MIYLITPDYPDFRNVLALKDQRVPYPFPSTVLVQPFKSMNTLTTGVAANGTLAHLADLADLVLLRDVAGIAATLARDTPATLQTLASLVFIEAHHVAACDVLVAIAQDGLETICEQLVAVPGLLPFLIAKVGTAVEARLPAVSLLSAILFRCASAAQLSFAHGIAAAVSDALGQFEFAAARLPDCVAKLLFIASVLNRAYEHRCIMAGSGMAAILARYLLHSDADARAAAVWTLCTLVQGTPYLRVLWTPLVCEVVFANITSVANAADVYCGLCLVSSFSACPEDTLHSLKTCLRGMGVIPSLVSLLETPDGSGQLFALCALLALGDRHADTLATLAKAPGLLDVLLGIMRHSAAASLALAAALLRCLVESCVSLRPALIATAGVVDALTVAMPLAGVATAAVARALAESCAAEASAAFAAHPTFIAVLFDAAVDPACAVSGLYVLRAMWCALPAVRGLMAANAGLVQFLQASARFASDILQAKEEALALLKLVAPEAVAGVALTYISGVPAVPGFQCPICLDDELVAECVYLPCFHNYHAECIRLWCESGAQSCPQCKVRISSAF